MNDMNDINERNSMKKEQKFMNVETGSVDDYQGWWYKSESGENINAVDQDEVVPVIWDEKQQSWQEGTI